MEALQESHNPGVDGCVVAISELRSGPSPRREISFRQVATLAELDGDWEPILVQRSTLVVVDGRHRLAAAKRLGHRTVRVRFFDGTDADARVEAIRLNVRHGVPLTLAERTAAAHDLLALHPMWSDRQLGSVCALSPRTIARLRADVAPARPHLVTADDAAPDKRVGKDGRRYPVAASVQREEIRRLLEQDRSASLRSIASRVGASPETVRSVRKTMAAQADRPPVTALATVAEAPPAPAGGQAWSGDTACGSTDAGREFAQWFDEHRLDEAVIAAMADAVPLSRVYGVIDESRRRMAFWESFAKALQGRARRRS